MCKWDDTGPAISLPSSWSDLHCGNEDLSWVDQGFFLSMYGHYGVPQHDESQRVPEMTEDNYFLS